MSGTARRGIATLIVAGMLPAAANAVVGPDSTFSGNTVYPTPRTHICIGGACRHRPDLYFAAQPLDCNKAGLATPRPAGGRIVNPFGDGVYQYLPSGGFGADVFPSAGSRYRDYGADQGPVKGSLTGGLDYPLPDWFGSAAGQGAAPGTNPLGGFDVPEYGGVNFSTPVGGLPDGLRGYVNQQYDLGGRSWYSLLYPVEYSGDVRLGLNAAGIGDYEFNWCRNPLVPTDPDFLRTGRNGGNSWGAREDDQWAIKRVGFGDGEDSAWNAVPADAARIVVAVIDTGLDWHHLDIDADSIWRNAAEDPDNGIDDDGNGYVDDVIGWNFVNKNNRPWDYDGHGTVVTGIIAAAHNDVGIAGINPRAKIMVLQAINNLGTTRASFIAEAIVYAVDNGAKIVNISIGGPHTSRMEQAAIEYARQEGVLVVAAAGNDGIELDDFGPGGEDGVLTVGATHVNDRAAAFSNHGDAVDLVAPGVDVLSLRARFTDANYRPGIAGNEVYTVGDNIVGEDKRYLHVSGTSFSTPIVTGTASLVLARHPELTGSEVERILIQTATDLEFPGKDPYTGYGMVNAQAALAADPQFAITAEITGAKVEQTEDGGGFVRVTGSIDAPDLKRAWMQMGPGENPGAWRFVGQKRKYRIANGTLGTIPLREFTEGGIWQIVINVEDRSGIIRRAAYPIRVQ